MEDLTPFAVTPFAAVRVSVEWVRGAEPSGVSRKPCALPWWSL